MVTNLELSTDEFKETFVKFDAEIHQRLKSYNLEYEGSKPIPKDCFYMLEEDPQFSERFKRVCNIADIPEADIFTPEVLEYTYVYMEIELKINLEGSEFSKVKKRLRGENGIPIGRDYEKTMLDTRFYEIEYLYGNESSLDANNIAEKYIFTS